MKLTEIRKIGIVGAGVMGPGIAEILAIFGSSYDFRITIYDISEEAIRKAESRLKEDFAKVENVGLFNFEELKKARERITLTSDLNFIVDSHLIIEAVPEILDLKKKVFQELDELTPASTILATNSSGLSISEIASATSRPELCIGTHFMNPPLLMPIVEVIKGEKTADTTVQILLDLLSGVNKRPVLVKKDIPGYVHNRLQAAVFRELMHLVDLDVMDIKDLETTVRYGLGLRLPIMRVFEMVDIMGIDTIINVLTYLYPSLDRSTSPPNFLRKMINEGKLGVKTGEGFHNYKDSDFQQMMNLKQSALFQMLLMMQQFD